MPNIEETTQSVTGPVKCMTLLKIHFQHSLDLLGCCMHAKLSHRDAMVMFCLVLVDKRKVCRYPIHRARLSKSDWYKHDLAASLWPTKHPSAPLYISLI